MLIGETKSEGSDERQEGWTISLCSRLKMMWSGCVELVEEEACARLATTSCGLG